MTQTCLVTCPEPCVNQELDSVATMIPEYNEHNSVPEGGLRITTFMTK